MANPAIVNRRWQGPLQQIIKNCIISRLHTPSPAAPQPQTEHSLCTALQTLAQFLRWVANMHDHCRHCPCHANDKAQLQCLRN